MLFASAAELRRWLSGQPRNAAGTWLRFAKKGAGFASVTKAEAIDEALCHGWIDGQLDKYDAESWLIRFGPALGRPMRVKTSSTRLAISSRAMPRQRSP